MGERTLHWPDIILVASKVGTNDIRGKVAGGEEGVWSNEGLWNVANVDTIFKSVNLE